jgi:hypothetical protein
VSAYIDALTATRTRLINALGDEDSTYSFETRAYMRQMLLDITNELDAAHRAPSLEHATTTPWSRPRKDR